jgi:hypothetical protein
MSYEVVSLGQLSQSENETIFGTALIATGMTRLQFLAAFGRGPRALRLLAWIEVSGNVY